MEEGLQVHREVGGGGGGGAPGPPVGGRGAAVPPVGDRGGIASGERVGGDKEVPGGSTGVD